MRLLAHLLMKLFVLIVQSSVSYLFEMTIFPILLPERQENEAYSYSRRKHGFPDRTGESAGSAIAPSRRNAARRNCNSSEIEPSQVVSRAFNSSI